MSRLIDIHPLPFLHPWMSMRRIRGCRTHYEQVEYIPPDYYAELYKLQKSAIYIRREIAKENKRVRNKSIDV